MRFSSPPQRTRLIAALLALLVVISTGAGVVTAATTVTDLDAPGSREAGDTVSVSAAAETDADNGQTLELKIYRRDTNALICSDTSRAGPTTVSCSGSFEMPSEDVNVRAMVWLGGRLIDSDSTTVTTEAPSTPVPDEDTPAPTSEPTAQPDTPPIPSSGNTTPVYIGGGPVRDDPPLPPQYTVNNSTGLIEPTSGDTTGSDETRTSSDGTNGLLGQIIGGITDTAKTGMVSVLTDFLTNLVTGLNDELIKALADILTYIPDVDTNDAVRDIYELSLLITFAATTAAVTTTGLLYQIGPIFGISYREARILLPRIIAALAFSLIALPLLQLSIDLTNAFTTAFRPDLFNNTLTANLNVLTAVVLALLINNVMMVVVAAVYIIQDVYVLIIAAISPLIALAWALPYTKKYATAFIGGWWTALLMSPLAMIVMRFIFSLMDSGSGLAAAHNWLYALAAWTLLLIIPFQLYGASQSMTRAAFMTVGRGVRKAERHYRGHNTRSPPPKLQDLDYLETMEMRHLRQRHGDTMENHAGYENHGHWEPYEPDTDRWRYT